MKNINIKFGSQSLLRIPSLHLLVVGLLITFWCGLFITGLSQYTGTSIIYIVFSLVFLVMLVSGFYKRTTYAYLFIVIFLWFGFWLKLTAHLIFVYPYVEPVGLFENSPEAWDLVLVISTCGGLGVAAARIFYGWTGLKATLLGVKNPVVPSWYPRFQTVLWVTLIVVLIGCAALNAVYGIQQSGLVPRTILIWPLNAAIYWMLGTGFAMSFATLTYWNLATTRTVSTPAYLVIFASTLSTVSLLSRGLYIFHTLPAILAIYMNRGLVKDLSLKRALIYFVVFIAMLLLSLSLVGVLRANYYSNVLPDQSIASITTSINTNIIGGLKFIIDRWIGLEGVMAVSSYPDRSFSDLISALTEKSEIGKSTVYQEISLAHYRTMDLSKFAFASLPGPVAFFYISDSLLLVILGVMMLTLFAMFTEKIVFVLTLNPFLSAFWGCGIANIVAQFGVAPRVLVPHFIMSLLAIIVIWIVQSNYFASMLNKMGQLSRYKV